MVEHANPMTMIDQNAIEAALMDGDLSRLTAEEKLSHYQMVCKTVGLNPLTKPFQYITLNGKLQMYALKGATDQLRKIYKIDCEVMKTETVNGLYVVQVKVKDKYGRVDEDMGFAKIDNLSGDALGNAMLKAVTKAKRRATLSMCGLGMLDEDEVKSIPAQAVREETDLNEHIEEQLKIITPPTDKEEEQRKEKFMEARGGSVGSISDMPQDLKENVTDAVEVEKQQMAACEKVKEGILVELQETLGMQVLDVNIDHLKEEAKNHIKGFTNMCDLYVEKKDLWEESLYAEQFQEIRDFCVEVKGYFEPYIGDPNE
tara:strand:+ start:1688 stop:2632 length:945 start_codon:yes stop_codon:yes gene_type:complete